MYWKTHQDDSGDSRFHSRAQFITACVCCVVCDGFMFDVQEERLVEKDCASWKLHGEPTVLLTMAHIFNQFAPLMVRTSTAVCLLNQMLQLMF